MRGKIWVIVSALAVLLGAVRPAAADLFKDVFSGSGKKKAEEKAQSIARKFKFVLYLTTGDVLKAVEYKGGGTSVKKGTIRFISNFESDIEVKTGFIKYIDMDMIGEQILEEEYASSKSDRVYLRNQDFVTGKVTGFTAKDVLVATTYGDLKVSAMQVKYVIFRNPMAGPEAPAKSSGLSSPRAPARPQAAPPAPEPEPEASKPAPAPEEDEK